MAQTYITGDETKTWVNDVIFKESRDLNSRITNLTTRLQDSVDELFYEHVSVPGIINATVKKEEVNYGDSNKVRTLKS